MVIGSRPENASRIRPESALTRETGVSVSFNACGCVCFSLVWSQFFVQSIAINNGMSTDVCHQLSLAVDQRMRRASGQNRPERSGKRVS